ncbi:glycoside hydrolase family 3 protein [Photobacterium damselae]|uniref:glycoside hydrolase family 3 N-terminal domain-containing protein n=1 Tax=Photobacterium damselae TaxID=38293 RepID=UPI002542C7D5
MHYFIAFFCIFYSLEILAKNPTPSEKYIEQYGIENAVAQLLVTGITSDYNNFNSSKSTQELLDLNVGGIMINAYNLPSKILKKNTGNREQALGIIKNFISKIKRDHKDGNKLLIAVDFESEKYSSIKYPLISPPSAMSITTNNSLDDSYHAGINTGKQLHNIGVNVLLGPVLDIDATGQGSRNSNITNRSYGGNEELVSLFASSYIYGLHENNIFTFAKHFPSYSFVLENPHQNKIVKINASFDKMISNLSPFNTLHNIIDGVMTSHITIGSNSKPLTVNKSTIDKILSNHNLIKLKDKIFITDDISGMEAINHYRNNSGLENANIVLEAFKAGHDLILISHLNHHSNNNFTVDDVKKSILLLSEYAKTPDGKLRLKTSLDKVLRLKNNINNIKNTNIDYHMIEQEKYDILEKATIFVSNSDNISNINFNDFVNDKNKLHIIGEKYLFGDIKKTLQKSNYINYISLESLNNKFGIKSIQEIGSMIINLINHDNFVVLLISNIDGFNILDYLRLNNADKSKILFSVHGSISLIKNESLFAFNIISNFDSSSSSSFPIGKILNGESSPRTINYSPVNIGNNVFFDLNDRVSTKDFKLKATLPNDIIEKKKAKNNSLYPLIFIIPLIFTIFTLLLTISILSCHAKLASKNSEFSRKIFITSALFSLKYMKRKISLILISIISIFVIPIILTDHNETYNFLNDSKYNNPEVIMNIGLKVLEIILA